MLFPTSSALLALLAASASTALAHRSEGPHRSFDLDKRASGMQQGDVNPKVDFLITYNKATYANTNDFCHAFHDACVYLVGPKGYHHYLDCVTSQKGPTVRAFCGGRKKSADGDWSSSTTIVPFTQAAMKGFKGAKIVGNPSLGVNASPSDADSGSSVAKAAKAKKASSSTSTTAAAKKKAAAAAAAKKSASAKAKAAAASKSKGAAAAKSSSAAKAKAAAASKSKAAAKSKSAAAAKAKASASAKAAAKAKASAAAKKKKTTGTLLVAA